MDEDDRIIDEAIGSLIRSLSTFQLNAVFVRSWREWRQLPNTTRNPQKRAAYDRILRLEREMIRREQTTG